MFKWIILYGPRQRKVPRPCFKPAHLFGWKGGLGALAGNGSFLAEWIHLGVHPVPHLLAVSRAGSSSLRGRPHDAGEKLLPEGHPSFLEHLRGLLSHCP